MRGQCDGPNADVQSLFNKVAAAYRSFKSASWTMVTVATDLASHKTDTVTTRLNISKPNRIAADVSSKKRSIRIVADGKSTYICSSGDQKKYLKAPDNGLSDAVSALSSTGGSGIGLIAIFLTDPKAETKIAQDNAKLVKRLPDSTADGEKCDVVNVQAMTGKQLLSYVFAFGKSDHFLRRVTISDPNHPGTQMITETYSSIKINPSLNASLFHFTPDKGAVAVDPTVAPPAYDTRVKVGAVPIPITGSDLSGKPVSLTQYKGKVLLLDFWATWCGPCLRELPNVIQSYGKYHAQGFDVVGITLDQANAKQKVQDFVTTNRMPWRQIYDGKYWSAANATAYGLSSIPFTLLIGRDGKVAAVGARGTSLGVAIEAALKRK